MEDKNTEYKSTLTSGLYKEIIAFANTDGGEIQIGVSDDGEVVGVQNAKEIQSQITNGIRDSILPDATMITDVVIEGANTIKIKVQEGSNKPYYLAKKGIKPSGVFVRQGSSSAPASQEQIRTMIKESDGDNFEQMRSINQDLHFKSTSDFFERLAVDFNENKFRSLGIVNDHDNLFTNLALILSDECPYTTKIAVFSDPDNTKFKDTKEFGGSIFDQLDKTFEYLKLCNNNNPEIDGLLRSENYDYPEEALREALINSLIHRDYSFSGSVIININPEKIEFISLGGLPSGLSIDDVKLGISQPRNKALAGIFFRLKLIESYGTGIRKIFNLYEKSIAKPIIQATSNAFKIILPNMNARHRDKEVCSNVPTTPQMKEIIEEIKEVGKTDDETIKEKLHLKRARTLEITKQMRDLGLIKAIGKGSSKYYTLC